MKKIMMICICTCFLVLTGCTSNEKKNGNVVETNAEAVTKKIENKDSFVLIVSLDTCPHCQDMKKMLEDTIQEHNTTVYRVELISKDEDKLYRDVDLLKKYLTKPGTIPHTYYIEKGKEKAHYDGYDEKNADQFWDFVKEHELENAK